MQEKESHLTERVKAWKSLKNERQRQLIQWLNGYIPNLDHNIGLNCNLSFISSTNL